MERNEASNPRRKLNELQERVRIRVYDGSGHPQNGCQGRASAGIAGRRSLTAGFSLHPLHVRSPKGDFLRGVVTRKEPETQASSDMERVRIRVYDGSGHPQNGCQGRASAGFAGRRSLTAGFSLQLLHTVKKRWLFCHLFLPQINETEQPYSGIPNSSQFILQFF